MVEQPDAQQVSRFPQPCGERPILDARRGISRRMIVEGNDRTGVKQACQAGERAKTTGKGETSAHHSFFLDEGES